MAKRSKPKLIPLRELRALCREAGVKAEDRGVLCDWYISYKGKSIFWFWKHKPEHRLLLKAYCLGLIAMKKAGEI